MGWDWVGLDGPLNASLLRAPDKTTCLSLAWKSFAVCHPPSWTVLNTLRRCRRSIWCFLGQAPNWNYVVQIKCWSRHKQKRDFSVLFCRIWSIKPLWSVNSARIVEGWSSAINIQLIAGGPMWVQIGEPTQSTFIGLTGSFFGRWYFYRTQVYLGCLLYTSDAADE